MAAEVPISDVLCEAMEYLSKLGSNLQTRSNNLKEKRIRKDKLRNNHAVQKAASKVLLICELSKKSLDNVETGVRKVLSLLEASQASSNIGGNVSECNRSENKKKYHCFEYDSHKLHILKKIPLKHYMSVKVLAKAMPASLQEKYPVYYDCKLKRQRRRAIRRLKSESKRKRTKSVQSEEEEGSEVTGSNKNEKSAEDFLSNVKENIEYGDKDDQNDPQEAVCNSNVPDDADSDVRQSKDKGSNDAFNRSENRLEDNDTFDQDDGVRDSDNINEENPINKLVETFIGDNAAKNVDTSSKNVHNMEVTSATEKTHTNEDELDIKLKSKKKKARVRFANVYSSDSDHESQVEKCADNNVINEVNLCSDEDKANCNSGNEPLTKKIKMSESNESIKNQIDSDYPGNEKNKDGSDKDHESDNNSRGANSQDSSQNESGAETRPLIRCVNLSKLLKPGIAMKKDSNVLCKNIVKPQNTKSAMKEPRGGSDNKKKRDHKGDNGKRKCEESDDEATRKQKKNEDDEYWAQKRNEVRSFTSKKFTIKITKLPHLNKNFLLVHKLKRITSNGNIICEIENEENTPKKIDAVKNALLIDSDSDSSSASKKKSSRKTKSKVNKENKKSDTESIKDTLLKDSDSESNDMVELNKESSESGSMSQNVQVESEKNAKKIYQKNRNIDKDGNSGCTETQHNTRHSQSGQSDTETPKNMNQEIKSSLLNDSSNDRSDNNDEETCNKANDPEKSSFLSNNASDEELALSDKDNQDTPTKTTHKSKLSQLRDSSDDESDDGNRTPTKPSAYDQSSLGSSPPDEDFAGFEQETPTKITEKDMSSIMDDSSDDKKESKEMPAKTNKKGRSSFLNDLSDKRQDDSRKDTLIKAKRKVKSSVLNETSDKNQDNSQQATLTKTKQKVKSSLSNDSSNENQVKSNKETPTKTNQKVKSSLLNDSSDEKQDKSEVATPTKTNQKVKSSLLNDSSDENQDKSEEETPTKTNQKVKSSLLNDSSDEKQDKSEAETPTKTNQKVKSSLLNDSSDENQDKNEEETPTKTNQIVKSSLLNDSSDEKQHKSEEETPTKTNRKVKSSLLNDSSDENQDKNEEETPTKTNQIVKSSLLNDSSDEKQHKSEEETPTKTNRKVKSSLLNDSSDEKQDKSEEETPTKTNQIVKSSLLNDSSDEKQHKSEEETPTKTNRKVKSSLLNDSSDEKQDKSEEDTPTKTNEKVKCSLLHDSSDESQNKTEDITAIKDNKNKISSDSSLDKSVKNSSHYEDSNSNKTDEEDNRDSSDVKSDSSDDSREKRKTPKSKRKHARKSREAKKKLQYSSSSDSEKEIPIHKQSRKKSHNSSSSSSSEKKTGKNKKTEDVLKSSNGSDNDTARSIDQVDGAGDHSDSSFDKMVRSKAKPSGSSSQNSDNQDASDKDIDRLTNLNNLNKNRQRESTAKNRGEATSQKRSSRSKATPILGEDLLKAESSDDVTDDVGDEFEQDLPSINLPGLNGDAADHMAHEDLLGESDSSVSPDKDQSEISEIMDETDGEQNLKLKRRKANAISSDSDGGSNRRKQKEEKMSDFEDSEEESSEPGKKTKRKKKVTDSDGSADSNDEGKKKRRRIKQLNDSDASGSDSENEGRNKHGRKNIRKVMGKNQLEEATKKAAREEKERVARIAERQKLYNNLDFDESGKPDEVVLEKVVLDFDPETKEPLIQVDRGLVKKLKPHQANGIKFMWDACFESVKRIKKDKGSGCILAHCMGLGKTLQVISLTHTLLIHGSLTSVNRVLVVCPLSTVLNWVNEFRMWLKHAEAEFDVDVYELSRYKQNSERAFQLQQWLDGGGVCVLGYEMFRNLSADNPKKFKKKMLKSFQESLVDPGPDLVVCDEGHLLKNEKTSLSQSMNRVKTRRRIVLTGTPLQNNLKEYYCMVQFVKPNLLGKYNEYLNRFVNPITNGQYTDSTEHDIRVMKRRSHVLHKMLDGAVQRRDYGVLAPFLPPKHEYVLFITLSDVQVKLYQFYLENYSRRPLPGKSSGFLFPDFQSLQRIWTHPLVLKYNSERYEIMQQKKREREEEDSEGSLVDFIDDDSTPDESSTEESTDDLSDMSDDSRKKSKKKKSAKKGKGKDTKASTRRGTRANPVEIDDEDPEADDVIEVKNENPTEWWIKLVEESELEDMRNSHKLVLLFDILRQCETIGDKLLVFSQSLYSLDLIEHFLGKVDEATQEGRIDEKLGGHVGSWSPGVDYFRLDGSTSCENRSIWCKNFNREDNPRARLFLISTRAGGLGINLVAANRVVIFDVSWNPSHDVQSIFRVYRFGQKKPCYIYRFLAMGTMEEKIYERQVTKQAISKRVIDEQQIDRHYAENDLAELYKFEARPDEPRPLPTLPKDRLFAEMLREHEAQIYKYHEHDSLLENKEEETLSEEERKAAWEDFENEKNKPPPAPFPSPWPMHNGMVPGLLAQQQQQLAYAALAAMLRKDMPNINDNQIRDMLPLIYNSNPGGVCDMMADKAKSTYLPINLADLYQSGMGTAHPALLLMQKMSEIYKYAQPGMMNPAMMNPVMNAGSGGGGMGGTSSLQYEPPWQRQHQQQQQMRLQQIMQQQNQMGAKFYAGGLGSRDPVAMALQQQRAREIMLGGGAAPAAARPRGRPPLHPRHAAATSPDVVNLDSD